MVGKENLHNTAHPVFVPNSVGQIYGDSCSSKNKGGSLNYLKDEEESNSRMGTENKQKKPVGY